MPIKFDVHNRWSGDVQFTAEIECDENAATSVKLGLAVRWAFKSGADLSGADLRGADLSGHKLADGESIIQLGTPNGWYAFAYLTDQREIRVRVGCQDKTIAEGRAYWAGKENRREVLAALDYADAIASCRGWLTLKQVAA